MCLFDDSVSYLGEIAHIVPHSKGGDTSFDNLIVLCRNCHKLYEPLDKPEEMKKLRQWKIRRNKKLESNFAVNLKTFNELEGRVKPFLKRNYQIFVDYGPDTNDPEAYELWRKFEPLLVSNNKKILLLLRKNINLLLRGNQKIVDKFEAHADEFEITREGCDGVRQKLFPKGLLSLFDIEEEYEPLYYVNPLQNFIGKLQQENQFISLSFFPPEITYFEDDKKRKLNLENGARVCQLFFNKYAYRPHRTDMPFKHLQFTLKCLDQSSVLWNFENCSDLTIITVSNTARIKLFYSYRLSKEDLQMAGLDPSVVRYVVNLSRWGGGGVTEDALAYGRQLGLKGVMDFDEFLEFCRGLPR